jgi:hypothetical protein
LGFVEAAAVVLPSGEGQLVVIQAGGGWSIGSRPSLHSAAAALLERVVGVDLVVGAVDRHGLHRKCGLRIARERAGRNDGGGECHFCLEEEKWTVTPWTGCDPVRVDKG